MCGISGAIFSRAVSCRFPFLPVPGFLQGVDRAKGKERLSPRDQFRLDIPTLVHPYKAGSGNTQNLRGLAWR